MDLVIYRIRTDLPDYMTYRSKELLNIGDDILLDIYDVIWQGTIKEQTVSGVIDKLESGGLDSEILLEESDVIEMLPDTEMLNNSWHDEEYSRGSPFLLVTNLGFRQVSIEKSEPFVRMSFERLSELFREELIWW